ncbi:Uncharacterised protein [Shigella sonnei]|nr:Uncharacterised protein [Shigella sonnei]
MSSCPVINFSSCGKAAAISRPGSNRVATNVSKKQRFLIIISMRKPGEFTRLSKIRTIKISC